MTDALATATTALIAVAVMMMAVVVVKGLFEDMHRPRNRTCKACGHDRGWHQTYRPASSCFNACRHPGDALYGFCGCPAGRRSIR